MPQTEGGGEEDKLKIIAISAVTGGGKTTIVNALTQKFKKAQSLHFDEYSFEGEVDDFYKWVVEGANYNIWNLKPLEDDILNMKESGDCDYLFLDYPFAYCNDLIKKYIDMAIFINTPLDVAMARRILRDMKKASGDEIRAEMNFYLKYARVAYLQMQKDILPSSDFVIDGTLEIDGITERIIEYICTSQGLK